ncbi:unnamed protein product [Paramecium primaurelia]|uniref:Uncharacterized protein n=1 Tax=Paramecium primaurelia TaxID=5886 RepID=A0A8S1LWE0_PARPR|nr:unnamed protein product [Paramecium primaurelia]
MQFDQEFGPWSNDQIRPRSRYNYQHETSLNKNISEIRVVRRISYKINSIKRSQYPKLKINNISPQINTKRSQNYESVKKREEYSEQHALPKLLENKVLLQLKIPRHRHTDMKVVQDIEKIIRRNLFYIPTHKYSIVD